MDQASFFDLQLLQGCCLEAERCDIVAFKLEGLRYALNESNFHLTAVIDEIRAGSRILREVADMSQVHRSRVPLILDPLNVVLPCLSRSLRDVNAHRDDRSRSKINRWRHMYHSMTNETGGVPLSSRFMVYNQYLSSARDLLISLSSLNSFRSPIFDLNVFEKLRHQIMRFREARSIPPPPTQVGQLITCNSFALHGVDPTIHWAERIFSLPLPSRTALRSQQPSTSLGHHLTWDQLEIPLHSKMLFRRSFNDDQISLTAFVNGRDQSPYLLLRTLVCGTPWFAVRGAHELCIDRDGSSLRLKRWSRSEGRSKTWVVLYFLTWEELVLMHSTFVSLKARNNLTIRLSPEECSLGGESKLFQACILDDEFRHSLIVYRDRASGAHRLHAAVWDGELRHCPSASSTWLTRVSPHRVRLADLHLYVFCRQYRPQNQRRGSGGAFEIRFVADEAARRFEQVFWSPPPTPEDSSDRTS
ncbi:hypothetical protein L249_6726 [Ophiocordyceps polyrhachis-furcata BCC 54312]|uniref:Uncharacterized protein n=1 Tax=Ophiocordyceps polyrhachis-furcata BCC 54312 TaxID=1330021 RepID=A0A367LKB0_9HYPO|nr:hypothetical protein L249_6726 [Ophiocordyceps polyrhachis-furcata BCC 54312]